MRSAIIIARFATAVLYGGLISILLWKFLTGNIRLSFLLEADVADATSPGGFRSVPSAGRTQALIVTVLVAADYLWQVMQHPNVFPQMSAKVISMLGVSHTLYLAGKFRTMRKNR